MIRLRWLAWRLVVLIGRHPPNGRSRHRTHLVPVATRTHWPTMTQTVRKTTWQIPVLLLGVALLLMGCGGKPDAAACEQALRKQLTTGIDAKQNGTQVSKGTKPPECNGLSDAELEKLGTKVLGEEMNKRLGGTTSP